MATWFDKLGSWLNKGFHRSTREDNGLGNFLNGIDNLWNRITGTGLTGSEREANEYSARQAELAFERESEFYEKNQSMSAQIAAQREAGINPFGINGSASAGPVVNSSAPSSVTPTGSQGFDPLALAMQIARFKLEKSSVDADNQLKSAQAHNLNQRTPFEVQKLMSEITELDERAQLHAGNLDKVLNESKLAFKSLGLTDKQIEHYDAIIAKLSSEVKTIDGLRDYEMRIKSADATIAEFESSVAELTKDLSAGNKASVDDFVSAFVKIMLTKFVGK